MHIKGQIVAIKPQPALEGVKKGLIAMEAPEGNLADSARILKDFLGMNVGCTKKNFFSGCSSCHPPPVLLGVCMEQKRPMGHSYFTTYVFSAMYVRSANRKIYLAERRKAPCIFLLFMYLEHCQKRQCRSDWQKQLLVSPPSYPELFLETVILY